MIGMLFMVSVLIVCAVVMMLSFQDMYRTFEKMIEADKERYTDKEE